MFKIIAFFATRLFVPVMSEDWHFTPMWKTLMSASFH
jgi:hypothetical protein